MDNLQELFVEQLKDVYSAEKQLTKALPKLAKASHSEELKEAFTNHLEETKEHVVRLETIFKELGEKPGGKTCAAMEGLVKEGQELLEEDAVPEVLDAGLIAAAQRVEHYEIAAYGTLRSFARTLGCKNIVKILEKTLSEEEKADKLLSTIAESEVNQLAVSPEGAESEGEDEEEEEARPTRSTGKRSKEMRDM